MRNGTSFCVLEKISSSGISIQIARLADQHLTRSLHYRAICKSQEEKFQPFFMDFTSSLTPLQGYLQVTRGKISTIFYGLYQFTHSITGLFASHKRKNFNHFLWTLPASNLKIQFHFSNMGMSNKLLEKVKKLLPGE